MAKQIICSNCEDFYDPDKESARLHKQKKCKPPKPIGWVVFRKIPKG